MNAVFEHFDTGRNAVFYCEGRSVASVPVPGPLEVIEHHELPEVVYELNLWCRRDPDVGVKIRKGLSLSDYLDLVAYVISRRWP